MAPWASPSNGWALIAPRPGRFQADGKFPEIFGKNRPASSETSGRMTAPIEQNRPWKEPAGRRLMGFPKTQRRLHLTPGDSVGASAPTGNLGIPFFDLH